MPTKLIRGHKFGVAFRDITGQKFGRLRAVRFVRFNKWHQAQWLCVCKCGNKKVIPSTSLVDKAKRTRSCGCLKRRPCPFRLRLAGKKFGDLRVIRYAGKNKWKQAEWFCVCKCGKKTVAEGTRLIRGVVQSCGCYRHRTGPEAASYRHGGTKEFRREYFSYRSAITRCFNEKEPGYEYYGARGITVCERWLGRDGFPNFLKDMGRRPEGMTLDRINVMGNYSPDNCRWADSKTQLANRRCNMTPEEIAALEHALVPAWNEGGEAAF